MRRRGTATRREALFIASAALLAVPALALSGARPAEVLAKLEPGRWLVQSAGRPFPARSICLGDPALLFQVEHGASSCAHELLAADERGGSVHYTCAGRGFGRTSVRIETTKVAAIETQGLVDGRPFSYRATARRVSGC